LTLSGEPGVVIRAMSLHSPNRLRPATFLMLQSGMKSHLLDMVRPALTDIGLGYIQAIAVLLTAYIWGKTGEVIGFVHSKPARAIRTHRSWVGPLLAAVAIGGIGAGVIKQAIPVTGHGGITHEHKADASLMWKSYGQGNISHKGTKISLGPYTTSVGMAWW